VQKTGAEETVIQFLWHRFFQIIGSYELIKF